MHKKFIELLLDTVRLAVLFGCIHSLTAQPAAGAVENSTEVRNYTLVLVTKYRFGFLIPRTSPISPFGCQAGPLL
jgi:hypothetical protein